LPNILRRLPEPTWLASITFSMTVKSGKMEVIWNERPMPKRARCCTDSAVTGRPAKWMWPRSGRISPDNWPMSVLLPAPLGPISAWISPARTSRSTWSVASSPP